MKRYLTCGMVLMALLLAGNAFGDGNSLLAECTSAIALVEKLNTRALTIDNFKNENFLGAGSCLGMMQGMKDMNKSYEVLLSKKALFCTPESGVSNDQAARIVVKYLKEHPEKLHEKESLLAIEAFMEAFPCK